MDTSTKLIILIIGLVLIVCLIPFHKNPAVMTGLTTLEYNLTECFKENNVALYGSYQCANTEKQKELLKESINYIEYIECGPLTQQSPICKGAEIKAYPTWRINNQKIEGILKLDKLINLADCRRVFR